jgi:hypothetical protein
MPIRNVVGGGWRRGGGKGAVVVVVVVVVGGRRATRLLMEMRGWCEIISGKSKFNQRIFIQLYGSTSKLCWDCRLSLRAFAIIPDITHYEIFRKVRDTTGDKRTSRSIDSSLDDAIVNDSLCNLSQLVVPLT